MLQAELQVNSDTAGSLGLGAYFMVTVFLLGKKFGFEMRTPVHMLGAQYGNGSHH